MYRSLGSFATLVCVVQGLVAGCASKSSGNVGDSGMVVGEEGGGTSDGAALGDGSPSTDAAIVGPDAANPDAASLAGDGAGQNGDAECQPAELPSPTCNAIAASGTVVTSSSLSGSPPTPQGGAVTDGTYVLVSSTYYAASPPPAQFQTTWVICGEHWDVAENAFGPDGGGGETIHVDFTASAQDGGIVLTQTCNSLPNNYS